MLWQVVVLWIRANLLQLLTMPGCVGVGVATPLPGRDVVVVGGGELPPPITPTQA